MGTWSTSITGNDTAADLRQEYTCAFFKYEPDEGVKLLDNYVRKNIADETDEEEWCNYVYSLADFMWKKGVLTDEIRKRAVEMIDSGFGLDIWADSGEKTLYERKKVLAEFREKLISPQPAIKKIKPEAHFENIFNDGELIAMKLITSDKVYTTKANLLRPFSQEKFKALDGKYILIQKIRCHSSWHSNILPEINDYWAEFRLFDGVYDKIPEISDISKLRDAAFINQGSHLTPLFCCESSMFWFKKRKYKVIGSFPEEIQKFEKFRSENVFLGVNREWENFDSNIVAAMGKEFVIKEYEGDIHIFLEQAYNTNKSYTIDYNISSEENEKIFAEDRKRIAEHIDCTLSEGGRFYTLTYGGVVGFGSVNGSKIDDFFIFLQFRRKGFSDMLLSRLMEIAGKDAHMEIPDIRIRNKLIKLCERVGLRYELI